MASDKLCKDFYDLMQQPADQTREEDAKGPRPKAIHEAPLSDRIEDLFEDLCRKSNINLWLEDLNSAPGLDSRVAVLLMRSELEGILLSRNTSQELKDGIEKVLSRCIQHIDDSGRTPAFSDAIAIQEGLLPPKSKDVELGQLHKVFLPGEIVYTINPTPLSKAVYEQCWMVTASEPVLELGREALLISGVKLCFDASGQNGCYLASAEVLVYTQDSKKRVTFEEIGIYPLKSLPSAKQKDLSDRMVARGRLYLEMSQPNVRCWQYRGPASCPPHHSPWQLQNSEGQGSKRLSHWMFWDSIICERVALNNAAATGSIQSLFSASHRLRLMSTLGDSDDKMVLICSGSIFVRTLPDFAWVSVFIDHLKPLTWAECALDSDGLSLEACLSKPRNDQAEAQSLQSTYRSLGKIVILRTSTAFMPPAVVAVAENTKQPLVRLDLFDIIDHEGDYLQRVQQVFTEAHQIGAYLYLENFSSLVAKRSCKDRKGCVEIRRFVDTLRSHGGVTLVSLSKQDDTDSIFDMMGLVELELHHSITADLRPRRHMVHYGRPEPKWEIAGTEDREYRMYDPDGDDEREERIYLERHSPERSRR